MFQFILFAITLTLILILLYYHKVKIYYVQQSIYEMRQSQHDIVMYIAENYKKMTDTEHKEVMLLLRSVNNAIFTFSKVNGMRFSVIKVIIDNAVNSSKRIESDSWISLDKYRELTKGYISGINTSLKAIPLLKLRLTVYLIKLVLHLLILIGVFEAKKHLKKLELFVNAENNHFNDHCLS